eukprot:gene280-905_t
MVKLHVKQGDESQFLFETTVKQSLDECITEITRIFNQRLKIERLFYDMETLAKHGICLPPNMQGLTDEQIVELKLKDEWQSRCTPSGGHVECKDPVGRRSGLAPNEQMAEIINRTRQDAKDQVSKDLVKADKCLTLATTQDAIDKMRGAVMIVYPMGLPPHDTIRLEFENNEDLSGTQAAAQVIDEKDAQLWWAGKELIRSKKLEDFVGKNEKTKIIVKIQKKGKGAPSREPVVNEEEQKKMMAYYYRKQEDMKKLEQSDEDSYLSSPWADGSQLKKQFQGVGQVKWKPF